jgi:hypothetical protein
MESVYLVYPNSNPRDVPNENARFAANHTRNSLLVDAFEWLHVTNRLLNHKNQHAVMSPQNEQEGAYIQCNRLR